VQTELVEAARHGDHDAFEALAVSVSPRLYAVARLILRDTYLAEDAVQETLVHIWRALPSLRDAARFDGWSYRLLVNACADAGRQRRRIATELRVVTTPTTMPDPSSELADREQLERGFRLLKPEQRAAVVLHYYLGLSTREIADALGVPVGTAKSRLHYATETLRGVLDADDRGTQASAGGHAG